MDQYIRKEAFQAVDAAADAIDAVGEEYGDMPTIDPSEQFTPPETETVEKTDFSPAEAFRQEVDHDDDEELDSIRQRGASLEEFRIGETEGHRFAEKAGRISEYLEKIEQINRRLKEAGSAKRVVATASDAPENAYVHTNDDGIMFYFKVGEQIRPSDVTRINKDDSWWLYDDDERVLKTILALAEEHPEAINEVDAVESAYTFTDRVLKTEDEVVSDDDVFTLKQQDAVVAVLVQANDF